MARSVFSTFGWTFRALLPFANSTFSFQFIWRLKKTLTVINWWFILTTDNSLLYWRINQPTLPPPTGIYKIERLFSTASVIIAERGSAKGWNVVFQENQLHLLKQWSNQCQKGTKSKWLQELLQVSSDLKQLYVLQSSMARWKGVMEVSHTVQPHSPLLKRYIVDYFISSFTGAKSLLHSLNMCVVS